MLLAFVNLDKWNALPKYYQSVLEQAGHYANNYMMARYDQANPMALKKLLASGTKLHAFPQPIMEATFKAATTFHCRAGGTDPVKRAIAYLKQCPEAVEGCGGHSSTFWAAACRSPRRCPGPTRM